MTGRENDNEQITRLWKAYREGTNDRIPVTIAFDEQFLLPYWGCSFRQYYQDVKTQIDIQLKSQKWIRENILTDQCLCMLQEVEMGIADGCWIVGPPRWMDEN